MLRNLATRSTKMCYHVNHQEIYILVTTRFFCQCSWLLFMDLRQHIDRLASGRNPFHAAVAGWGCGCQPPACSWNEDGRVKEAWPGTGNYYKSITSCFLIANQLNDRELLLQNYSSLRLLSISSASLRWRTTQDTLFTSCQVNNSKQTYIV